MVGKPAPTAANRLGLDYEAESTRMPPIEGGIIDVHTHIGGTEAARIFLEVAEQYGISLVYSMTHLEEVETVSEILGDRLRLIAVPGVSTDDDRLLQVSGNFIERLQEYHAHGCRIVKFWVAPRTVDLATEMGMPGALALDAPARLSVMEAAADMGMMFMVHVADPDTWFQTRYRDEEIYGTKRSQYEPLEKLLDRFTVPWIAAHMGGWPENLDFLDHLLNSHPNLYLDTSATKWMIRELSRHPGPDMVLFFQRHRGRLLFGSDIVTLESHLDGGNTGSVMSAKASTPREAYDLYASRYWALRTFLETTYEGSSPIADPDLSLLDPETYTSLDAPILRGIALEKEDLDWVYNRAAHALLEPLHATPS